MAKLKKKKEQAVAVPAGESGAAPQSVGDTTAAHPDRDRIAMRAYELYLARGRADGAAMDDWLSAERELVGASRERSRES